MALRGSNAVAGNNDMKQAVWAIIVLAVTTGGCAVSESTPSSNYVAEASTVQQHVLTASSDAMPDSDNVAEPSADDDFDLLEEEFAEQMVDVADPLEPLNRIMFGVNDKIHLWVLKPVATAYKSVIPEPVRIGIRNFFNNLTTPARLVNCLLQGKSAAAGTELHRFALNTTVGVLGFGDPALNEFGLESAGEDLGQTLAVYGLGNGFYIVWPFMGPSTVRDSVGMAGDQFLNPTRYVDVLEISIGISAARGLNASSFHVDTYETLKSEALEPYVAMRQSYIQRRNKQIEE
jgi:phospholipid-binding lipoprotein MlaA